MTNDVYQQTGTPTRRVIRREGMQYADIILQVNKVEIKCHRNIMAVYSEVLRKKFDSSAKSGKHRFDIDYAKSEAVCVDYFLRLYFTLVQVEAMVDYCYSGWESPKMDGYSLDLLILAHRYKIADLLDNAVFMLRTQITLHNWCAIINAADHCGYVLCFILAALRLRCCFLILISIDVKYKIITFISESSFHHSHI
jgi:hypothetical protein